MVKFGGHVEAIREGDLVDAELYLVPYNKMKRLINEKRIPGQPDSLSNPKLLHPTDLVYDEQKVPEDEPDEEALFLDVWKNALKAADDDFTRARGKIWQTVFAEVAANDDGADPMIRGAHPGNALKFYVDLKNSKGSNEAQELLSQMKLIYRAASVNAEALRKLVKKFDKHRSGRQLSSSLLPSLYTSALYSGQNMIHDSIGLLRELIEHDGAETTDDDMDGLVRNYKDRPFQAMIRRDSEARHKESVDIRMMEFNWLKSLVGSIPSNDLLPKLVAHRGFHHTKDRNDKRPVENSLSAYEMAWSCGVELCECDIALTKDEKLVLAHDEDFVRLSLDSGSGNSKRKVSDLTLREIISMPLSNGVRPPLLIDVLRSASAISEKAKLIIEIKPGNEASAFALARLLVRHPDLRASVAMIMSFDAATMHQLRAELDRAIMPDSRDYSDGEQGMPLESHRRVASHDHFGTMSSGWLGGLASSPKHSSPLLGSMSSIGLSISQMNLNSTPSNNNLREAGEQETIDYPVPQSRSYDSHHHKKSPDRNMPKLMLLTVADPPHIPCELQVQYNELHRVDQWLEHDTGALDGVYLQFEKEMMTPEGAAYLRELSERFMVGIWGYANKDPDNFETFEWLVKQGNCSFVNTDLPKDFRKNLMLTKGHLPPLP